MRPDDLELWRPFDLTFRLPQIRTPIQTPVGGSVIQPPYNLFQGITLDLQGEPEPEMADHLPDDCPTCEGSGEEWVNVGDGEGYQMPIRCDCLCHEED